MKEKEFNERLQLDDEIIQDEVIEKTLKKSMRKQINGRIYRTLLLILVAHTLFQSLFNHFVLDYFII